MLVMGVVNVTPDSFSDGGRFLDPAAAVDHLVRLIDECGAGHPRRRRRWSTRPGAAPTSAAEEIERVVPVVEAIRHARPDARVSIDTMKPAVARAAVAAGATMWNDVTALRWAPDGPIVAAELGCDVVLMHMQVEPGTMQAAPRYGDVVAEVAAFLALRADAAVAAGVARDRIWLDPGFGFGKTPAHNLALIRNLPTLAALGFPVLVGASRKSSIVRIAGDGADEAHRLGGSIALALAAAAGAQRPGDPASTTWPGRPARRSAYGRRSRADRRAWRALAAIFLLTTNLTNLTNRRSVDRIRRRAAPRPSVRIRRS